MPEIDADGHLVHPEAWTREVAVALARAEGIAELTAEHWKVVEVIRAHYLERGIAPLLRGVCRRTGLNLRQLYALFPAGPARGAAKIAGLPREHTCVE